MTSYYFEINLEIFFEDMGDYTETKIRKMLKDAGAWEICIADIIPVEEGEVKVKAPITLTQYGYSEQDALEDAMEPIRRALLDEAIDYDWELDRTEVA